MNRVSLLSTIAALLSVFASSAWSADHRLVVRFKDADTGRLSASQSYDDIQTRAKSRVESLARGNRMDVRFLRPFENNSAVAVVPGTENVQQVLQRLRSDPNVLDVQVDRRIRLHAQSPLVGVLNSLDPSLRSRSWFHQDLASQRASINTGAIWANFHGTSPTVIAVVDTGVLPSHPALKGHLLPGYDFVTDPFIANDGTVGTNSRDADPTDPGDARSLTDVSTDTACGPVSSSTWHGTFVSALLAGNPAVSEGIFSVNWNAVVLPIRVLGKCGGFSTDLADGIRWAAGLPVAGVPANPFPAKVINLSLGTDGVCNAGIEGAAVSAARAAGSLVVVATGNQSGTSDSPANCPGAFAVAAVDQEGLKASYSNADSFVQLVAPGGDAAFPIWSASNTGPTTALTNTYATKIGTSFAAPMVSGAAGMLLSLNGGLSVSAVESLLKSTARPFISVSGRAQCASASVTGSCVCNASFCGAGMLDVANLINTQRSGGLTNLFSNTGSVIPPGQTRTFSAAGSINAAGVEQTAVSFSVSNVQVAAGSSAQPGLAISGTSVDVTAPSGVQAFDLVAKVEGGRTSIVSIVVENPGNTSTTLLTALLSPLLNASTVFDPNIVGGGASGPVTDSGSSPAGGGGSGGGGGHLGVLGLLGLALGLAMLKRRRVV